jgi:nicotinamidase/pyrazinamidase
MDRDHRRDDPDDHPHDHPQDGYGPGTALVVVDMQNDFADPAGSLYVAGGEDLVGLVNDEIDAALAAGSPVLYTQDWHPPSTPHFAKDGGIWPVHCVAGTPGARFHPGLRVVGPVGRKGTGGEDGYSGFTMRDPVSGRTRDTPLGGLLDEVGAGGTPVRSLVVVGLAGDYCVVQTALDGVRRGYQVQVPLALTRFVNLEPGDDARAARDMRSGGVRVAAAD